MAKSYSIETLGNIIRIRFDAEPRIQDIMDASHEVFELDKIGRRLWNFTKGMDFKNHEIERIASYAKSIPFPPSKIAIVAPNLLSYGIARAYGTFREQSGQQFMIFHDEKSALEWLNQ